MDLSQLLRVNYRSKLSTIFRHFTDTVYSLRYTCEDTSGYSIFSKFYFLINFKFKFYRTISKNSIERRRGEFDTLKLLIWKKCRSSRYRETRRYAKPYDLFISDTSKLDRTLGNWFLRVYANFNVQRWKYFREKSHTRVSGSIYIEYAQNRG